MFVRREGYAYQEYLGLKIADCKIKNSVVSFQVSGL
jgi:hypothetical protein